MAGIMMLLALVALGPLAARYGVDSRSHDEHDTRGWMPGTGSAVSVSAPAVLASPRSGVPSPTATVDARAAIAHRLIA